jgi:DNA-binding MarR family transcriptional regulator
MTDDSTTRISGHLQKEVRQNKPFASLQAEAFLNLVRTTGQLQHTLRLRLKPYGITETQYNPLRILRGAGNAGLTCAEIAERLISRDPDITRLLGRLERMGLVRRERDTKDRRSVITRISRQGLDRLKDLDQVVADSVTASLAHLTEDELRKIIRLLERTLDSDA